ncbi:guanylate kinase [Lentisphaerota bacterium WC36G]|nr:guanylate kinase [Lentisphaerae bacterium WC36]
MSSNKLGTIFIVSGPSGVGKSTILKKVKENFHDLQFSVSCTTRSPRPGEENGVAYHFIEKENFIQRIENNEFIEYAQVFDNYYGTLKSEVIHIVEAGSNVFLDIDVQGAMQIKEAITKDPFLAKCCEFVMITPPSLSTLEQRLRGRQTETEEQLTKRLSMAKHELSHWKEYDFIIVNDALKVAVKQFCDVLNACKCKRLRLKEDFLND